MRLVDCHCHLESEQFGDGLDAVLDAARKVGVVRFVTASITPEQWPVSRALAARYPDVAFAPGVHPWYVRPEHLEALAELRQAADWGACALGEIGLDRKVVSPSFELQEAAFERQLAIAYELRLAVVMHCRGAFGDLLRLLKRFGRLAGGGIVHNFSGSAELVHDIVGYGLSVSLGGTLTYRNSRKKQDVLRAAYPEHLVLETDSPDLPPVEKPERPNVPANILYALRAASELLGETEERVAEQTTGNALRIFAPATIFAPALESKSQIGYDQR